MKIVQATILSILAALILIVAPSGGPALGQTVPDDSAAVLPAPVDVEKGTAIPYLDRETGQCAGKGADRAHRQAGL
jgi:hypothetical protein